MRSQPLQTKSAPDSGRMTANQKLSDSLPLALKFRPKKLQLDRMDRELKGGAVEEVAARA